MKFALLVPILLYTLPAAAQENRRITYEQAALVFSGLEELDGPRKSVRDNGTVERDPRGYDIDLKIVVVIADDKARARECLSIYQSSAQSTQKKWADPKTGRVPDESMSAYVMELSEANRSLCTAKDFVPIRLDDLKPIPNKYPPSVISNLLPILILPDAK